MAEDRMLSDEVLLALIKKNSGGGGTSDYSQLTNKPEINGVTLSGDKSASDLSLASLDANGKVPAAQLPSYVDDVINGYLYEGHFYEDAEHQTEITGESGKIYIDLETNKTYRWSGLAFVEISESLALGETASTAYAGDKGKANADAITAIKDGTTIDSFGDVESALANKVDKVDGKGLSTNDYTDADATIVAGVTTALSGKQDKLTAGEYIDITSGEISVNRVIPNESASYELKTTSTSDPNIVTQVIKTSNGSVVWTRDYNYADVRDNPVTIDNMIILSYTGGKWKYELLVASDDHSVGYYQEWNWSTWIDYTEDFSTIDNTGKKLIIKSEMDTALALKQDTLTFDDTPTDGSNNPVKSDGIYDALALKQPVTDNNLTTTDKTTTGAINELKSGLIDVNVALDVPANSGKNLVDASTFDSYTTDQGITVTPNGTGGIAVSGQNSGIGARGVLLMQAGKYIPLKAGVTYRFSGNWSGVTLGPLTLRMDIRPYNTLDVLASEANGGIGTYTPSEDMNVRVFVRVAGSYEIPSNVVMTPVITTLADTSYTPYIPSVESRLEALEAALAQLANG